MKCPFKKIVTTKDEGEGNIKSVTKFGECDLHDCMAYKKYQCLMMEKGDN